MEGGNGGGHVLESEYDDFPEFGLGEEMIEDMEDREAVWVTVAKWQDQRMEGSGRSEACCWNQGPGGSEHDIPEVVGYK